MASKHEPARSMPEQSEPTKKLPLPNCRFYGAAFPAEGELVVAQIQKKVLDMGYSTYVALLEYNGITGYVDSGEVSRWSKSMGSSRLFSRMRRIGHIEVCVVLKVDMKKGMIDLSKKRVELGAAMAKEKTFAKAKLIHNVMRQVARQHDVDVEDLCAKVTWPLYKSHGEGAYEVLSRRLHEDDLLPGLDFRQPGKDLSKLAHRLKADIAQSLRRRLASQRVRVWAKIEVTCAEHAGILAIQGALAKGIDAGRDDCQVSIRLITHPQFMVSTTCHQRADGLQAIERAFEAISGEIRSHGGTFFVRSRPMLEGPNQEEEEEDDEYDFDDDVSESEDEEGGEEVASEGEKDALYGDG